MRALLPQFLEPGPDPLQRFGTADLLHGEGNRRAAHDVVADAVDRVAQVAHRVPGGVECHGVRHAQQPGGQDRFSAGHTYDLVDGAAFVGQHHAHAKCDIRQGREIDAALRELGREALYERESGGILLVGMIGHCLGGHCIHWLSSKVLRGLAGGTVPPPGAGVMTDTVRLAGSLSADPAGS